MTNDRCEILLKMYEYVTINNFNIAKNDRRKLNALNFVWSPRRRKRNTGEIN
jgi:hypothetical protein